jgi:hypothetical protein
LRAFVRAIPLLAVCCAISAANSIIVQSLDTPLGEQQTLWINDNGDGFAKGAGTVYQSTDKKHPTDATVLTLAPQYESMSLGKLYEWASLYRNVTVGNGSPVQNRIGVLKCDGGPFLVTPEPEGRWLVAVGPALIGLACWTRRRNAKPHY